MNSCHDTCELSHDVVMPLTNVSRVVTRSVVKNRSISVDGDTSNTTLQTSNAVNDNTGTSLNDSASNMLGEDVVSADYLNDCDPSNVLYVELITEQHSDPPRAFQRAIDEPCRLTLPLSLQRVAQNAILLFFSVNFNFCRNKSAAKFLRVKTSSCKVVAASFLHLTVHRWIAGDVPNYLKFALKVTHRRRKTPITTDFA